MKAYTLWNHITGSLYWVAQVPGNGGTDWGYTTHADQAMRLSPYWQRRFTADCRSCGMDAQFI